jgi:hypothetical protein
VSEMKTTAYFAAAAAVSLGLAWAFRPTTVRSEKDISDERKGQAVFADFNPDTAASFRIVKFNEDLATLSQLELTKDPTTEVWTLPSADGYPADSAEQVSQAVAPLTDLTVLSTVSTDRSDHVLYGVVEPKEDQLDVSTSGVGMLLRVGGPKGELLAELIVGKAVKDAQDQRYVRVRAEDAVYVVQLKTDAYSTQFEKWIKGEILNVRSMDITNVGLRDYAILPLESGGYGLSRNFDSDLEFKDNKWSLQKFVDHKQEGSPETTQPPEGQVLADTALNDLRNSVQNLKIVSVRRKPAGLAADLKAAESFIDNKESTKSLQSQGFFPMENRDVYATGGELIVGTKDGVRYSLRFGNTSVSSAALEEENKDENKDEGASDAVRRYMLVTAQLDESKFPAPELKVVPETVEEMLAMEAAEKAKTDPKPPTDAKPATIPADEPGTTEPAKPAGAPATTQPAADPANATEPAADPNKTEPVKTEPDKTEPATATEPAPAPAPATEPAPSKEPGGTEPAATEPGSNDPAEPPKDLDACGPVTDPSAEQEATAQEGAAATTPAPTTPDAAQQPPAAKTDEEKQETAKPVAPAESKPELAPSARQETPEELKERLQFLQETIKKENQRLIDARNESIKQAKKKVDELNASFADWYYIVSDSVYAKLRVSREQLFKAPDAAKDPTAGAAPGGAAFPPGFGFPPGN